MRALYDFSGRCRQCAVIVVCWRASRELGSGDCTTADGTTTQRPHRTHSRMCDARGINRKQRGSELCPGVNALEWSTCLAPSLLRLLVLQPANLRKQ